MNVMAQLKASLSDQYLIEREIGAGGMATVYLARDVRHDRYVALKVLNPELGAVLGVERFLAEIKVTANLQHPNLLPLFDSGEAGGLLYYVMPFVEGESLRVRLEREKQLPIDEALRISVAVASALDYAHSHGVIHRDLKPENILLQAGQPVIADFGIALAVSKAGGNRITQTGLSLGTPQYMSPEQATGDRVIDGRSDIYSLAAMTYEMLAGEAPHTGNTAQAIIARVLTDKPRPIRSSRSAVPEHVEAAVEHALEKLPADRFSTAREFAEALQGRGVIASRATTSAGLTAAMPTGVRGARPRLRDPIILALGIVAVAALGVTAVTLLRPAEQGVRLPIRFALSTPDSATAFPNFPWPAAISPDGGTIVYSVLKGATGAMLYSLRLDQLEPRPIPGTLGAWQPLFSPDGQWVEFEVTGKEKKVRLDGSAPVTIADGGGANGADWTSRDEIIIGASGTFHGLSRVHAAGGDPVEFTHPDSTRGERDHVWPVTTPDGKGAVFIIWSGTLVTSRLAAASLDKGNVVRLDVKAVRPLAVVDDALIYVQADGAVMAVPFDASALRVTGKPVPVHDPVSVVPGNNGNSGVFVSRGGAMMFSRGGTGSQLVWASRDRTPVPVTSEVRGYRSPRISPDGRRIAVVVTDGQQSDLWIYDLSTRTFSRLTSVGSVSSVEWTSDSKYVVFSAAGQQSRGVFQMQLAAGGTPAQTLFETTELSPDISLSPDRKAIVAQTLHDNTWDLFSVTLGASAAMRPYVSTRATEFSPRFSADGRWVAASSDESGRMEVYVRSFPEPSSRVQISVEGGLDPRWSAAGDRIYYSSGNALLAARVSTSPEFRVLSRDTVLTTTNFAGSGFASAYDVTRDGRVLGIVTNRADYQLVVAPYWGVELRQRLAASRSR